MIYLWSAINNAFFPDVLLYLYIDAGWDVSDCKDVDQSVVDEFLSPGTRVRVVVNGMPAWEDIPEDAIDPEA